MDELHLARSSLLWLKQSFAGVLHQSCDQFLDNTPLPVEVNIVDCRLTWQRAKSCGNRRRLQVRETFTCLPSAYLKLVKIFLNVNRFQCKIFVQRWSSTFDRSSSATDHYWPAVKNLWCSCVLSNVWLDVPSGEPRGDMGLLYKVCSINISITVWYLTFCLHASITNMAKSATDASCGFYHLDASLSCKL